MKRITYDDITVLLTSAMAICFAIIFFSAAMSPNYTMAVDVNMFGELAIELPLVVVGTLLTIINYFRKLKEIKER